MWDNRPKKATGEFSAKSPDFKCKDKECDGVIWPGETVETHVKGEDEPPTSKPRWKGKPQQHNGAKDEYWERKLAHEIAVQPKIIRQHSQSMALEVLKLKVQLNELTVEDLTPAKLRSLADYFDKDVLDAAQ
jgi:hypothetical protein